MQLHLFTKYSLSMDTISAFCISQNFGFRDMYGGNSPLSSPPISNKKNDTITYLRPPYLNVFNVGLVVILN